MPAEAPAPPHLPDALADMLCRAQASERTVRGPDRRCAFRVTRHLIGAALDAGYAAADVAACLNLTEESVCARAERGSWLTALEVQSLVGGDATVVARLVDLDVLTRRMGVNGEPVFSAAPIVRTVS
jgi:hypothetical protein